MNLKGARILVLEDEALVRRRLESSLARWGMDVSSSGTVAEARRLLKSLQFDFALLDVNLPDGTSLELLEDGSMPKHVAAVLMTALGGVEGAVEAMRLGAHDYVLKPLDPEDLKLRLLRARKERGERRKASFRKEQEREKDNTFYFGLSLAGIGEQIERIQNADRRLLEGVPPPVLLEGETGTGKTTLARRIHDHGPRANGPFVEVNCSALPENLIESELFGHERGAFTDARQERIGLFEAAEGGTLFLDEISSMPLSAQAKLLTAIEAGTIRRVGGNRMIPVNTRIIAAANVDLGEAARSGLFRADLFHRLDLFRIHVPALRERKQDIVLLAKALLARIAPRYGIKTCAFPQVGIDRMLRHRWPGNVRELAHEIERSLLLDGEPLTFQSLAHLLNDEDPSSGWWKTGFVFPETGFALNDAIKHIVGQALEQTGGNVSAAARLLGVPRDYIRYRERAVWETHPAPVAELGTIPQLKAG